MVMACRSDVLPAPVGPVIAKRSSPSKSTSASSTNAVYPRTRSLRGLTQHVLVEIREEGGDRLWQLRPARLPVVRAEARRRVQSGLAAGGIPRAGLRGLARREHLRVDAA